MLAGDLVPMGTMLVIPALDRYMFSEHPTPNSNAVNGCTSTFYQEKMDGFTFGWVLLALEEHSAYFC